MLWVLGFTQTAAAAPVLACHVGGLTSDYAAAKAKAQ